MRRGVILMCLGVVGGIGVKFLLQAVFDPGSPRTVLGILNVVVFNGLWLYGAVVLFMGNRRLHG